MDVDVAHAKTFEPYLYEHMHERLNNTIHNNECVSLLLLLSESACMNACIFGLRQHSHT